MASLFLAACGNESLAPVDPSRQGPYAVGFTSAACSNESPAPVDPSRQGPYAVGFTSFVFNDTSRVVNEKGFVYRPVPVLVWYPVDARSIQPDSPEALYPLDPFFGQIPSVTSSAWEKHGTDRAWQEPRPAPGSFPVILFSHGYSTPQFGVALGTRLASQGFVFATVLHFGDGGMLSWYPAATTFRRVAYNRPRDLSFALTQLLELNRTPGELLHGVLDAEHVAAAGFSFGGFAAMALAAGDDDVCDFAPGPMTDSLPPRQDDDPCGPTAPDPRIKAIVSMDGSNQFLHLYELRRVSVPSLSLGRDWDSLAALGPLSPPSWQARQHAVFGGQAALRVNVVNTTHDGSFGDLCTQLPVFQDTLADWQNPTVDEMIQQSCTGFTPWATVRDIVGLYTTAFLKTHLLGESGYAHILTPAWTQANQPLVQLFERERVPRTEIPDIPEWPADSTYFRYPSEVR